MQSIQRLLRLNRFKLNRHPGIHQFSNNKFHSLNHSKQNNIIPTNLAPCYFTTEIKSTPLVDEILYEKVCEETLESLNDYFEELVEECDELKSADISYSSGVLTVNLGQKFGTYVINRQSPNRQIWLSSPTSGPKRYDYVTNGGYWVYKHDGRTLHQLLQEEISKFVTHVDFSNCTYAKL